VIESRADMRAGRELQKGVPLVTPDDFWDGGQETTILTLMAALLHLGMILVGVPYSVQELLTTQGGGSPYGPGHVAGADNTREITPEVVICRAPGRACHADDIGQAGEIINIDFTQHII
jgi:multimeric flavodoxin WrbA